MVSTAIPPDYSGAGAQAYRLASGLGAAGTPVTLVTRTRAPIPPGLPPQTMQLVRISPPGPRRVSFALFYLAMAAELVRGRRRYRVVHVHGIWWAASVAAVAAWVARLPLVAKVTLVGSDDAGSILAFAAHRPLLGLLRSLPLRRAAALVATTAYIRDDALRRGVPAARVRLLPNSVDTGFFRAPTAEERQAARSALGARGALVLFCGGFIRRKGLHVAVQAFSQLAPETDAELHITGPAIGFEPGDEGYADLMRQLMRRLGVEDRCRLTGWVDADRLRAYFWAADVLVFPSASEGMPNLLFEALSCGTPCVAGDIPGVRSVGIECDLLRLADPADPDAVAAAITDVLAAGRTTETMECAHAVIDERLSMDSLVRSYRRLYDELAPDDRG